MRVVWLFVLGAVAAPTALGVALAYAVLKHHDNSKNHPVRTKN